MHDPMCAFSATTHFVASVVAVSVSSRVHKGAKLVTLADVLAADVLPVLAMFTTQPLLFRTLLASDSFRKFTWH